MVLSLLVENIVDLIPFFGNLFDFAWQANVMNVRLAERYLTDPAGVQRGSRFMIAALLLGFLAAAAIFTALSFMLIIKLVETL